MFILTAKRHLVVIYTLLYLNAKVTWMLCTHQKGNLYEEGNILVAEVVEVKQSVQNKQAKITQ